jgi:Tfp pilus assembly protein PilF
VALGELAWLDRKPDAARAHLADALARDPGVPLDHDALGRDLTWQQRADFYAAARSRYEAATAANPAKAATLRFYEGRARCDGGDWTGARAQFAAALAADPAATNNHYYLFVCGWRLDDHDAAETHAAAYAAAGGPPFADVLRALVGDQRVELAAAVQYLADRAFQQGRVPHSRDLNHVLACYKDSADAWNNHAFLCRETGRFDDAVSSYQHALEKEPDSPQLCNDLGVVLQYHLPTAGNLAKARSMYDKALQLAARQLADPRVVGPARERAQKAQQDATANLAALEG